MQKEACNWLKAYLEEHGETSCEKVIADAKAAGFSREAVRRAKHEIGVLSRSDVRWSLPEDEA